MKNLFIKLFCIFAFILSFVMNVNASEVYGINSVVYDDSASFLVINSFDSENFSFAQEQKLYIINDENKAYFDINSAVLKCPVQDFIISSPEIKEIKVSQFSTKPDIVRVVIYYNDGYNPQNISLSHLGNTLFLKFKTPVMSSFYFQPIYSESPVGEFYENTSIQSPVTPAQNSTLGQINSAFKLGQTTEDKNFILAKKDLVLPTKFYIDNITSKNNEVVLTGVGSATFVKSVYLQNPVRAVFDIPNSLVNPVIRNKEISINRTDSVKAGQFNRNTARVVITSSQAEKYIPVIYGDTQRIVFTDKNSAHGNALSSVKAGLTSAYDEISDVNQHTMKLVFSKPVITGISRTSSEIDLLFYNVDSFQNVNVNSALMIDGVKMTSLPEGGAKLTIPAAASDIYDIHLGTDGKTLRIKAKVQSKTLTEISKNEPLIKVEPVVPIKSKHQDSKKKYIVIDPGHGGTDCGATRNGIYEKNITLDISKRVVKLLKKKDYVVEMTRTSDETVSLQDRVEISEDFEPDIFVSIHVNSSNSEAPHGIETHYYKDNSLDLAKNIHAAMLNNINANNRGLFKSKFYVINHTTAPAVLVEIGFLSNPEERAQIVSEARKQATAKAIVEGINDYFKQSH